MDYAALSHLRQVYPGLYFTHCLDDDINDVEPALRGAGINLYLVDGRQHCLALDRGFPRRQPAWCSKGRSRMRGFLIGSSLFNEAITMAKIGLFYATDTGNTRKVARMIKKQFDEGEVELFNIKSAKAEDLTACDALLGTPTLGDGELPEPLIEFLPDPGKRGFERQDRRSVRSGRSGRLSR